MISEFLKDQPSLLKFYTGMVIGLAEWCVFESVCDWYKIVKIWIMMFLMKLQLNLT